MSEPTHEKIQTATKIPGVLMTRLDGIEGEELIRRVYNEAIEDAALFLESLASRNIIQNSTLMAAGKEVRAWLVIPVKDTE